MTKWILVLYVLNGWGSPLQRPIQVETAGETACLAAARTAMAGGFNGAICLNTQLPTTRTKDNTP